MTDEVMEKVLYEQSKTEPSEKPKSSGLTSTELERLLKDHGKWLDSKRREGKRIDLQGVDLQGAGLSGSRLEGAIWGNVSLEDVSLREAGLQGAELSHVKGLLAGQLAGANLSGAELPEDIHAFEGPLRFIEEGSKNARKLFFGMLAGSAYTVLTIGTTTDVRLLTNSASSPLPIIGTEIPIVGFFIVAPLLLLGVYLYFHLYMQRLWEGLSRLPAIFPDGRSLDEKAYPWLLIGYVRSHVRWLKLNRPSLSRLQTLISILLTWWVIPSTLVLLWARFLPRHDWFGTGTHILVIVISIGAGIFFQRSARRTLRCKAAVHGSRTRLRKIFSIVAFVAAFLFFGAIFYLISREGIESTPPQYTAAAPAKAVGKIQQLSRYADTLFRYISHANLMETDVSTRPANWTGISEELGLVKGADLRGVDLRHANAYRAFLINADLRDADLRGAMLAEADLRNASLLNANIEGTRLQLCDLRGTVGVRFDELEKAKCWPLARYDEEFRKKLKLPDNHNERVLAKDLKSYNLSKTNLEEAVLVKADLREAKLESANLQRASLVDANLYKAKLQKADLRGVDLKGAEMGEADLSVGNLRWADLRGAYLTGTNFLMADLQGAVLKNTDLRGTEHWGAANLHGVDLQGADLRGARFENATGLAKEQIFQAKNWVLASYNKELIEALGLPSDHNKRGGKSDLSEYVLRGADLSGDDLSNVGLEQADLQGANLRKARLVNARLARAILKGGDLRDAQLEMADLRGVDLRKANLKGAQLPDADLRGADFEGADLEGALLGGVNLKEANFKMANLKGVNLRAADLSGANLKDADLSAAKLDRFVSWVGEGAPGATVTVEQLCEAKTLYSVHLEEDLIKGVNERCPHLLEEPKKDQIRSP